MLTPYDLESHHGSWLAGARLPDAQPEQAIRMK